MNTAPQAIPIAQAVSYGWETFKKHAAFILGVEIAAIFAEAVVRVASNMMEHVGGFHEWAMGLAYFVVTMIVHLGAVNISLRLRDGETVEFANLFDGFGILPPFMASAVITYLAVTVGTLFLVVPGIVIAVKFGFFGYAIADRRCGPVAGIERSIHITKGVGLDLFLFGMLLIGLNFLGVLCLGFGVFVTMPVSFLAAAWVYRYLEPRPSA